jgi:hypothetical protein
LWAAGRPQPHLPTPQIATAVGKGCSEYVLWDSPGLNSSLSSALTRHIIPESVLQPTGSAFMDSTQGRLKIFEKKIACILNTNTFFPCQYCLSNTA